MFYHVLILSLTSQSGRQIWGLPHLKTTLPTPDGPQSRYLMLEAHDANHQCAFCNIGCHQNPHSH